MDQDTTASGESHAEQSISSSIEQSKSPDDDGKCNSNSLNRTNDNTCSESEISKRLNQELSLSTTHRYEIESHWRQILRKEKFQELHDEITPLSEYHSQNVSRKKGAIESIQHEFDHLQELHRKAMVANIFRIDDLITIHDDYVLLLRTTFRERVEALRIEFCDDAERINAKYDIEENTIQKCIRKQHQKDDYMAELMNQDTQHELEEIKNRNLEDINSLRFVMDSKVEDLEEQFEQANADYAQSTDFSKASYEQLKARDMKMHKEIRQKTRHADRLQNEIQRFQLMAKQEEVQNRERHQALLERKTRAIQKFHMTKDEMAKFRKEQQKRLIVLSRRANEIKEVLKQQSKLAERVMKIAMSCRKWETSREQFASALRDSLGSTSDQAVPAAHNPHTDAKNKDNPDMNQLNKHSILLQNNAHRFWDKYNMAKLDVVTLEKRVSSLKRKEQDLRKKLKMYHDGVTVNDDVLKNRNPLLVINGKMNALQENTKDVIGRKMPRRLTVVDANQIIATHNMARVIA